MTELASQVATAPLSAIRSPKMPEMEFLKHIEARLSPEGLLQIRSPALFSAYLFPQASQLKISERFIPAQDANGWFQSQDLGEIHQQGKTFLPLGRRTDEIKISGELVRLDELDMVLEECVLEQNFRHEVALALCPDMRMEFSIALAVAGGVNSEVEELMNCFNSRVMSHEKIREAHAVDRIPRTDLGKLLRHRIELKSSSKPV
jgi:acyl-CoA synthetase (AMP-forming)/AMP-acid ligase II